MRRVIEQVERLGGRCSAVAPGCCVLHVAFSLASALGTACSHGLSFSLTENCNACCVCRTLCRTDIVGDGHTPTKSIRLGLRNTSDDSGSHQFGCWQRTCLRYLIQGLFLNLSNLRRCLVQISEVKLRINVYILRLTEKYSIGEVASIIYIYIYII